MDISTGDSNFLFEAMLDPIKTGCQVRHPPSHRDTSKVHLLFHVICSGNVIFRIQCYIDVYVWNI